MELPYFPVPATQDLDAMTILEVSLYLVEEERFN
jgi:hypothetical protein